MIDDFCLWGSSRCRQVGRYLSDGEVAVQHGGDLATHDGSLSEGGAVAGVMWHFPEMAHQTRDNTA